MIIAVAVQNDFSCRSAVKAAVLLTQKLESYKLYFVYAVPKASPSSLPYLDQLDKIHNVEVHHEAIKDIQALMEFLDAETRDKAEYEFVKLEKQMDVNDIFYEFVENVKPDLFYVGSHRSSGLKKFVLGSVSQFCVDRLPCPVVVVKPDLE